MLNISVLSGGILHCVPRRTTPDLDREGHALEVIDTTGIFPKEGMQTWYFSFFSIAQGRRNDELSLLSYTHSLQTLVPTFESLQDAQGKPNRLTIVMFVSGVK